MNNLDYLRLISFGIGTVFFKKKKSILATIILTDQCNLSCKHCAVNNMTCFMDSYEVVRKEMAALYNEGNRILFFCGGETYLWRDGDKGLGDLVREAKRIGFYLVNIVTNGILLEDIPEADVIFLSLDGLRESHDAIRGETFERIMAKVRKTRTSNICVYMAINAINYLDVEPLTRLVQSEARLRSISFNFHTPYPGTESLSLTQEQKQLTVANILSLIDRGYPVFNLKSGLRRYLSNRWRRPSYQCLVSEQGTRYPCGRCVEIAGLCQECGYIFAVEFSLIFNGHLPTLYEMFKTYKRFVS